MRIGATAAQPFFDEILCELDHGMGAQDPSVTLTFLTVDFLFGMIKAIEARKVVRRIYLPHLLGLEVLCRMVCVGISTGTHIYYNMPAKSIRATAKTTSAMTTAVQPRLRPQGRLRSLAPLKTRTMMRWLVTVRNRRRPRMPPPIHFPILTNFMLLLNLQVPSLNPVLPLLLL